MYVLLIYSLHETCSMKTKVEKKETLRCSQSMVFPGIHRINNKCLMLFRCYKLGLKILVCVHVKTVLSE